MQVDGDAARASRLAAVGEGIDYTLAGQVYRFPPEMPMAVLLKYGELEDIDLISERDRWWCDALLGDGSFDRIVATTYPDGSPVSGKDVTSMIARVLDIYAVDEGESSSSGASPATPGESSSGTASARASSRKRSGKAPAASAGSGASS